MFEFKEMAAAFSEPIVQMMYVSDSCMLYRTYGYIIYISDRELNKTGTL